MKKLTSLIFGLIIAIGLFNLTHAQGICKTISEEKIVVYDMFNKKDTYDGSVTHTFVDGSYDDSSSSVTVQMGFEDSKGKEQEFDMEFGMVCADNVVSMSMNQFLSPEMTKKMEGVEFEINADDIDFPASLTIDQILTDGTMTADVLMNGTTKLGSVSVDILNRTVEAKEMIETESGTYETYKINSKFESKVKLGPIKIGGFKGSSITWWSQALGLMVKTQDLDKKGRVRTTTQLKSVTNL
jgi:hypothetical protein